MALVTCPDCTKTISDSAGKCPHCGRPMQVAAAPPMQKSGGCLNVFLVLCLVGVLGVGGCFVVVLGLGATKEAKSTAVPSAAESAANQKRLWLENISFDDTTRAYIIRGALRKADQRCDSVESQIMGEPGEWTIRCAPGYRYLFKFDESGKLISAVRAQ